MKLCRPLTILVAVPYLATVVVQQVYAAPPVHCTIGEQRCGTRSPTDERAREPTKHAIATRTTAKRLSYDETILKDRPVAYWAINGTSSETDLTGRGHTGTYQGGQPTPRRMPNGDDAAVFDGTGEYLRVPSSAALSIATRGRLTWEGWIMPTTLQFTSAPNGYVDWMGKCATYAPDCEWEARIYNSVNSQRRCNRISAYAFNPSAGLGSGAYWQQQTCGQLKPNHWIYVVGEYQTQATPSTCNSKYPGTIDIWVNGQKWNSAAHTPTGCMSQYHVTPQPGNSPLHIGTMARDSWFEGAIGKVAVYDRLLSPAEISRHYMVMTSPQPGQ